MIKTCAKCKNEKHHNMRTSNGKIYPMSWCNECVVEYRKDYQKNNYDPVYRKKLDDQRRDRGRLIIREAKDKPCTDCHTKYPFYVMQFDHISNNKEHTIARMIQKKSEIIMAEIDKCEVVCANCHAERTYKRSLRK